MPSDKTDLFHEVASIDYPIIDADAHVNEPPDLWQDARAREACASARRGSCTPSSGDVWLFDDGKRAAPARPDGHARA